MTRGEPNWGVFYKSDSFPQTYAMSYEEAISELSKFGDDVSLMVWFDGDWTEFVSYD